jgi:hypothetical protein
MKGMHPLNGVASSSAIQMEMEWKDQYGLSRCHEVGLPKGSLMSVSEWKCFLVPFCCYDELPRNGIRPGKLEPEMPIEPLQPGNGNVPKRSFGAEQRVEIGAMRLKPTPELINRFVVIAHGRRVTTPKELIINKFVRFVSLFTGGRNVEYERGETECSSQADTDSSLRRHGSSSSS